MQRNTVDEDFHPVMYMSRNTSDAEKKRHSYELEVLAIVEALKKFRVYLLGIKFKLVTDCEAFKKTLNKEDLSPKVGRWALMLEDFDYEVELCPGTRLKHVDALSRNPVMIVDDTIISMIRREQDSEERLRVIKQILNKESYEDYFIENGILRKQIGNRNVIVLPTTL